MLYNVMWWSCDIVAVTVTGTMATAGTTQMVECAVDSAEDGVAYTFEWFRGQLMYQVRSANRILNFQTVKVTDARDDYHCKVYRPDDSVVGYSNWTLKVKSLSLLFTIHLYLPPPSLSPPSPPRSSLLFLVLLLLSIPLSPLPPFPFSLPSLVCCLLLLCLQFLTMIGV